MYVTDRTDGLLTKLKQTNAKYWGKYHKGQLDVEPNSNTLNVKVTPGNICEVYCNIKVKTSVGNHSY